jgi:capsule biosynthesis phosphatase
MKFVVLCGGAGVRLAQSSGFPKPWNFVLGIPMLQYVLEKIPSDEITLILNKDIAYLNLETTLPHYVKKTFHIVYLHRPTRGALETAYLGIQQCGFSEDEQVCFVDNDTVYSLDSVVFPTNAHFIGYSTTTDSRPYCYLNMDGNQVLTGIAEKQAISQTYACGLYGISSVREFQRLAKEVLMKNITSAEFYMSNLYHHILSSGTPIHCLPVSSLCLGTPFDIANHTQDLPVHPLRVCFDIDNTLLKYRTCSQSYKDCEPIQPMIDFLRSLKSAGHTIILHTARGMASQQSNLGRVMTTIAADTFESLDRHNIPYDELYFGKPHANIYIDDRAFNPYIHLLRATGFPEPQTTSEQSSNKFNRIVKHGNTIEKIGPTSSMRGEVFFYTSLQSPLFPKYLKHYESGSTTHLFLEFVNGCTLYELLRDGLMTTHHIEAVVDALDKIHNERLPITITNDQVYDNYIGKLRKRIQNKSDYPFENATEIVDKIDTGVRDYLFRDTTRLVSVVHGDPWFSNTLLTGQSLVFLDMKGDIAGTLTTNGDALTDFGKIYQSLLGFDWIVNNHSSIDVSSLTTVFLARIQSLGFTLEDLNNVTACLIAKTLSFMDTDIETRSRVWNLVEKLSTGSNV